MARLAPPQPESYTERQTAIADAISATRGSIRGPFGVWLHAPGLAETAQAVGAHIRFSSKLPGTLRELAICTIARHWRANFEWYAHAPLAVREGIAPEAIELLKNGSVPDPLSAEERLVYELAKEMIEDGRLSEGSYGAGIAALGAENLVELVGLCGYYTLVSLTLNVFEVDVPDGEPPFAAD